MSMLLFHYLLCCISRLSKRAYSTHEDLPVLALLFSPENYTKMFTN
jgi:hypothetical protein